MSAKYTYRGYLIYPGMTVFEAWTFHHEDYDPTPINSLSNDGRDHRAGGGETIAECKEKIDRLIDEN